MFKRRHALIPSCILFGPLFISRVGGSADGTLGVVLSWWGGITLTYGLYLMFDLLAQQQALIDKLRADRQPPA